MLSDNQMSTSHSLHYDETSNSTQCTLWYIRLTKLGRIVHRWDKFGTFSGQISVNFGSMRSAKVPGLFYLGANLTHFGSKSDISCVYSSLYLSQSRRHSLPYLLLLS